MIPRVPQFQDYPVTLANANDVKSFDVVAAWVACYFASEEFEISIAGGPFLGFNQGLKIGPFADEPVLFSVKIRAKAGAAIFPNTIVIRVGEKGYEDNRFSVTAPLQIAAGAVIQPKSAALLSGGFVALVANTNAEIVSANAARRCVRIRNPHATEAVRVSSTAAELTAGNGEQIAPGETREFFVTGVIYGRCAANVTVNVGLENFA